MAQESNADFINHCLKWTYLQWKDFFWLQIGQVRRVRSCHQPQPVHVTSMVCAHVGVSNYLYKQWFRHSSSSFLSFLLWLHSLFFHSQIYSKLMNVLTLFYCVLTLPPTVLYILCMDWPKSKQLFNGLSLPNLPFWHLYWLLYWMQGTPYPAVYPLHTIQANCSCSL